MKKKLLIFFLFILNSSLLKGNSSFPENNGSTINLSKVVNDDEESEGLYAHIPDWHFEYFLYIKGYDDILGDRKVLISNIDTVKIIDFSDESSADYIKTLKGIEYFKTLESFKMVGADSLKAIDLSQNISLKKITLWNIGTRSQRIPALDLSNNLLLEELDARGCHLSELDLSNNIMLKKLRCSGNELKELNLSNNISLKELNCSMNQLSVLDVSNLRDLENLEFNYNNITSIDVSQAPLLKRLSTSFNNLKELNLSNNSLLETLILVSNNLRTIDVSDKPLLRHIALTKNQLNSLDISRNRKLKNLYCAENNLSNLNLSNNLELIELYCQSNQLKNIDVTRHVNLEMLNVSDNDFSTLDVTNNDSLYLLACRNLNLKELDLSNKDLFWLYCDGNLLSDLDLSQQIWLTELYCSNNPLKELNLEHNSELQILSCSNIGLDSLDLSTNPNLYELDCSSNNLKELDLSNNYIKNLDCSSNQLDFLNLKKSPNLGYLNARNNAIECIQIAEKGPVHDIVWNPKKWLVDRARHSINCEFVVYSSVNTKLGGRITSDKLRLSAEDSVEIRIEEYLGYELLNLNLNDSIVEVKNNVYKVSRVTRDLYFQANFQKKKYTLRVEENSNGTLSFDKTEVLYQESATLTVIPNEGYRLKTLKINDEFFSVTSGTYVSENVTTDLVAEAEFDKVEYSISLNNPSNGSLSSSLTEVAHGESVTFTVTPAEGYRLKTLKINDEFFSVTSGTYVSENVTSDLVAEAEFDKVEYSISLNNPSNGSLSSSLTEVAHGESVTFTVTPAEGYRLKTLKINDEFFSVTSGTYVSENVTSNLVAEAEFDKVEYSISLNNPSNGSLSSSLTEVAHGESVTFTVTPAEGYRLKTLKINDEFFSVTSGTYVSENVTTDLVAEAEFDKVEYSISLNNPSNGSLSSSLTEVAHGESVTFTVTPAEGYRLKTLKINDEFFSVTSGTYVSENVTTDLVAEAEFDKVEYSISLNNPSNGSLSSSLTEVAHGESVTFTVTPAEGYRLKTLKINDEFFSVTSGTYVSENVTSDLVAEAEFDKVEYSISLNNPSNGSLSSSLTEVAHGESVTFTVTPAEGYLIKDVLVNGVRFGDLGTYTVSNVVEDKTIEAIFIEIKKVLSSPILNKVNLYPNPVEEQVTLSGLNEEHNYQVIGLIGNVLYSGRISTANNKINLSALKSGNYYISIDDLGVFKIYKK